MYPPESLPPPDSEYVHLLDSAHFYFAQQNEEQLKKSYGEQQDVYRHASALIVQDIVLHMKEAKKQGGISSLISRLLPELGAYRQKLAYELGTPGAEDFGVIRKENPEQGVIFLTWLGGPFYGPAGKRWANSLDSFLCSLFPVNNSRLEDLFRQIALGHCYTKESRDLHRSSQFRFTLYNPNTINSSTSGLLALQRILFPPQLPTESRERPFFALFGGADSDGTLLPLFFQDLSLLLQAVDYLQANSVPPTGTEPLYFHATTSLEIGKFTEDLSNYFLRVDVDEKSGEIRGIVPPLVVHTSARKISFLLQEIDKIAEQILSFPEGAPISAIIDQVGLFRYLFAHAIPFFRGSAAVGEWIETAFYHCLGFEQFHQNPSTTIDLEAFSSLTLGEFMKRYHRLIAEQNFNRIKSGNL